MHIEIGSTMKHGLGIHMMCRLGRRAANASGCVEIMSETHSRVRSPTYLNMYNAPHEGPGAASSRTVPLDAVVGGAVASASTFEQGENNGTL